MRSPGAPQAVGGRVGPRACRIPYVLREYGSVEGDEGLVYLSYLRSFWRHGVKVNWSAERRRDPNRIHGIAGSAISERTYKSGQRGVIDSILGHAGAKMACNPEDRWQSMGFVIFDDLSSGLVLHYVYVKRPFRRFGLGTQVVLDVLGSRRSLVHTHMTEPWVDGLWGALERRGVECSYDPYLAR